MLLYKNRFTILHFQPPHYIISLPKTKSLLLLLLLAKDLQMGHSKIIKMIRIKDLLLLLALVIFFVLGVGVCNAACRFPCHSVAVGRAQEHEEIGGDSLDDDSKDNDPYRMYGDVPSPGIGH